MSVDVESVRRQAMIARAQAAATVASMDALLSTLPQAVEAKPRGPRTLGDDDTPQEQSG
jgi:hypothetical protein